MKKKLMHYPNFRYSFFLVALIALITILDVDIIIAQDKLTKKGTKTFQSKLVESGFSEDWPYAIYPSDDCIHVYFAGFVEKSQTYTCGANNIKIKVPVMGKYNSLTNALVWEKEYNVTVGHGEFNNVIEIGDFVWATGGQNTPDPCGAEKNIIVKVNRNTGIAESGYPTVFDVTEPGLINPVFRFAPIIENGVVTGMYGSGYAQDNNGNYYSVIVFTDLDGNVIDLDPGNPNESVIRGPLNTDIRKVIKIEGHPEIQYIFIGYKDLGVVVDGIPDYDAMIGYLDVQGKSVSNWPIFYFSESSLSSQYTDLPGDEPLCNDIGSEIYESNRWEDAWDIVRVADYFYVVCRFDRFLSQLNAEEEPPAVDNKCNYFTDFPNIHRYEYTDIALLKLSLSDGSVVSTINVGVSDAPEFFPDMELKDGKLYILGATASDNGNGDAKVDAKLNYFDLDLNNFGEQLFSGNWLINCSFDIAFNCDGELIVCGNNEVEDENYYFYKFSNGCQKDVQFNGANDVTTNFTVANGMDVTWNTSRKVNATVRVASGGILRINGGAVIEFGASWDQIDYDILSQNDPNTKVPRIIVEGNGKLYLNNCILKGLSACANNAMWDGIEVHNEGEVFLTGGATILDAKFGTLADIGSYDEDGHLNPTETGGGATIIANQAYYFNCRRAIHFAHCLANSSEISASNFICNAYLKDPVYKTFVLDIFNPNGQTVGLGTSTFISANQAPGVKYSNGNEFSMSSSLFSPALRAIGLRSINSTSEYAGANQMSGLRVGIQLYNTDPLAFTSISGGNNFTDVVTGIEMRGGGLHSIVSNNIFNTKYNAVSPVNYFPFSGIGIYNAGATLTRIEDNTFSAGNNNPTTGTLGLVSENTGSGFSLHKKNTFDNIGIGDQTQKENGGLNIWCNDHIDNTRAWNINPISGGTFPNQGNCATGLRFFPNNDFEDAPSPTGINHIQSSIGFTYWTISGEDFPPINNSTIVSPQNCFQEPSDGCIITGGFGPGEVPQYFSEWQQMGPGVLRENIANELLRHFQLAYNYSGINTILSTEPEENYKMTYALFLLKQGETNDAINVVANLPANSVETADFTAFFNVLLYADQNNLKLWELPSAQQVQLEGIAENRSIGAYNAQVILQQYYGKEYLQILETENGLEYRQNKKEIAGSQIIKMVVSPNPANKYLSVRIPKEIKLNNGKLIFHNIDGIKIKTIDILEIESFKIIDLNNFLPGVYSLSFENGNVVNDVQKVIIY